MQKNNRQKRRYGLEASRWTVYNQYMGRYAGNSIDMRASYTDIGLVYTKTGFRLNPKSSSKFGQEMPEFIFSFIPLTYLIVAIYCFVFFVNSNFK